MRLLGCHINNFGIFHNYDLTFNDGLNVVMQANGWGKTTLAAFVKAMLYGFDGKRVRNVAENERLRYKPWQGGRYGGSLDFAVGDREYRVIRTFGATRARDRVKVLNIETGKSAMDETGPNVGEWLFGLDANAFQKSVYVVQNGFGLSGSSASLRNRLNALVNEADDVAGFDGAQAKLEERRKYYRRTGNRGAIADVSKDVAKLVEADAKADAKIAELRRLEDEMAVYAAAIGAIDNKIGEAQKAAEQDQAAAQRVEALRKVEGQLRAHRDGARTAYERAMSEVGGEIPTDKEMGEVRQGVSEIQRLEKEAARYLATADAAAERGKSLAEKYPAGPPQKDELQSMRGRVAQVRAREAALKSSAPARDPELDRLCAVVESNPGLIERSEEAADRLEDVLEMVEDGGAASRELEAARAGWGEKRKTISRLAAERDDRSAAVPANAESEARELRLAARELRSAGEEIVSLQARLDTLEARCSEERAKLEALPGGTAQDASAGENLDAAAKACADAIDEVNRVRSERDAIATRLKAAEKSARDTQAKVDGEREDAAQAKPGLPIPAIACFVVAAAAIAAGMALGPVLFVVGAILAVVGVALLVKGRSAAPTGPSEETIRQASEAASALADVRSELDVAEQALAKAEEETRAATDALVSVVEALFPGERFDSATVAAQVPVLKERLAAWPEQAKRVEETQGQVDSVASELDGARSRANAIMDRYAELPGDDYAYKAAAMEARASELDSLRSASFDARERLAAAVAEEMGVEAESLDDDAIDSFLVTLERDDPPEADELVARERRAHEASEVYAAELSSLLVSFGAKEVGPNELAVGAERLSKEVAAYRDALSRQEAAGEAMSAHVSDVSAEVERIETWASEVGAAGIDALTDEWFDAVAKDIDELEKAKWEERRAREEADKAQAAINDVHVRIDPFLARYGIAELRDASSALDDLAAKTSSIADLKRASQQAESELQQWLSENKEALESPSSRVGADERLRDSADQLETMRQRHDVLVREKAKREEQRNAILESLETRLVVRQEIELLSKRKQRMTSNLFTIQKTAEYLLSAREGLDGRYLGDLSERFQDYANAWLVDDEIDAVVGPDFDVSLYEGYVAHDVAGYSTGYRDVLDMCFRMAIVDTVFQAEPPFLIMDDPFASMDAGKIGSAFLLLQALSKKYQIIYFTCHPSRTEEQAAGEAQEKFVLPEQHARRELPRARAKREAEERAKAQAQLVASYHVAPVTKGCASILPAGKRHSISSNLFSVKFVAYDAAGDSDNSFEVHFIDDKGHVLCDRQTVEVIGGRVVPDKVRFSLVTRDDSGDTYDMIIHENGREPAELAARIPYRAEVSFATDDFGF